MKDKHLHIAEDSELLKTIHKRVQDGIVIDQKSTALKLSLKFAVYFLSTAFIYTLLYITSNPALFILFFILFGFTSLLFAFNFAHDLSHNTIFKSKKLNNICYTIIYSMLGAHAEAWKLRHVNSHHYAPNVADYDSDLKITKLIRVIPNSEYFWFHKYQHIYAPLAYTSYSLFWIFIKDTVILFSKDDYSKKKGLKYHLSFWIQKLSYLIFILILPLLYTLQPWYLVITGFLLMHLSLSLFLLFTFFMTHHVESTAYPTTDQDGIINTSWLMNQIKSANDMHPFSEAANFILGGFNNHIAHHLFPNYNHIHYPRLNLILYATLKEYHIIPNQTTYWGGIVSHLRLLKKMGLGDQI
ncbi:fatty acid desaturase family protein [Pedobacter metabolipauper]|uniref:Linoleoyl-CoA desaturase n=1 Tax=Pedobacter metabolipauper TaxID=425513 RepID=A0A4V3D1M5_9SPHI|nr:fatty acid desaturase [Pedobacter metabolipauper]TDQ11773.1 linoleoyl-CoA desaturase [Pedobacter metabolipauper]